jgi:natural product precursor
MKKNSRLKLNQLVNVDLNEQEMNILRGGGTPGNCCCGCNGPSSTADNSAANNAKGLRSPGCTSDSVENCVIEVNCIYNWDKSCHGKG